MLNVGTLAGYTIFITGASRGIGKEIALKAARDGAKVVVAAKTAEPHPKLPGTIYTAAEEIEKAGGKCLPCVVDVRSEESVQAAADQAVKEFGGIDILINNASAISLTGTQATPMKVYDLMNQINARGTYLCSRVCLPHLIDSKKNGKSPHILNISPPLNMKPVWFKNHTAYSIAKYGMSMCVLGMAAELRSEGIAVNALWPRTAIYTAAMEMLGSSSIASQCRKPLIMADAAYSILIKDVSEYSGDFLIDDEVLKREGITDFDQYAVEPGKNLFPDFFLDTAEEGYEKSMQQQALEAESQKSGGNATSVFEKIRSALSKDLVGGINGIYKFVLSDPSETWILDLKNGNGSITQGEGDADCTMTMKGEDFVAVFEGKLNATQAFMQGKFKVNGNMGLAMKLEKVMKASQSAASQSESGNTAQANKAEKDGADVANLMGKMKSLINADLVGQIGGVYHFILSGDGAGEWVVDLKNGDGKLSQSSTDSADVTMKLDGGDFVKMLKGELNATQAFMSGKLTIEGNMGLAMKLEKIMKAMK